MALSIRKTSALLIAALLLAVGTSGAQAYAARVSKADIKAGGGTCAGSLCTINGTMWDCSGGGYCTRIYS
jgi:hypothetical protein